MSMSNIEFVFREKLKELLNDQETVDAVCHLYEWTRQTEEEERKVRQMEGIKKAKESGIALGRPRLQIPDNFEELLEEWENGNLKADMAARVCGMGISTFYRRVRMYKDEKDL